MVAHQLCSALLARLASVDSVMTLFLISREDEACSLTLWKKARNGSNIMQTLRYLAVKLSQILMKTRDFTYSPVKDLN